MSSEGNEICPAEDPVATTSSPDPLKSSQGLSWLQI